MSIRIHADDLGLHPAVDRAVFKGFEAGAIQEASILATGPTFKAAARQARALGLPLSLHLAIVDTAPLSRPSEIPALVGPDGRFPPFLGPVARRSMWPGLPVDQIRLEIGRQLAACGEAGLIGPAGLVVDGHQHLHLLPRVFQTLLELASDYRVAGFRLPRLSRPERARRTPRAVGFRVLELLGARAQQAVAGRGPRAIPCWGVLYAGHLTSPLAREVLAALPPRADGQLICHPGDDDRALSAEKPWGYAWEGELAAVLELAGQAEGRI